ncbi:MAG: hypothetical protein D6736_20310, partial [Nitrospinota bacterium]
MRKWLVCGLVFLCALALVVTEVSAVEISAKGRIRVKYGLSNFSTFTNFGNSQTELNIPEKDADSAWTVRERMRNWWTFKLNDHLKAVWAMEIGYLEWGQSTPTEGTSVGGSRVGRGSGGGYGADGVNIETKQLYMQFDIPMLDGWQAKMGLIGHGHTLADGALWSNDSPAVEVKGPVGPMDIGIRWVRRNATNFNTATARQSREANMWFFDLGFKVPDGSIPFAKGVRLDTGLYYFDDNTTRGAGYTTEVYVTGLNIAAQIGPAKISNKFAYGWQLSGAASKREADPALAATVSVPAAEPLRKHGILNRFDLSLPIGPGNFKFTNYFVSGDPDRSPGDRGDRPTQDLSSFPNAMEATDQICFGAGVEILCGDLIDEWILFASVNNDDLGLILNIIGYDVKPTKNTKIGLRIAPTWSAAGNPNSKGGDKYMGTEIALPIKVKIWDGLSIDVRPAYFITGS